MFFATRMILLYTLTLSAYVTCTVDAVSVKKPGSCGHPYRNDSYILDGGDISIPGHKCIKFACRNGSLYKHTDKQCCRKNCKLMSPGETLNEPCRVLTCRNGTMIKEPDPNCCKLSDFSGKIKSDFDKVLLKGVAYVRDQTVVSVDAKSCDSTICRKGRYVSRWYSPEKCPEGSQAAGKYCVIFSPIEVSASVNAIPCHKDLEDWGLDQTNMNYVSFQLTSVTSTEELIDAARTFFKTSSGKIWLPVKYSWFSQWWSGVYGQKTVIKWLPNEPDMSQGNIYAVASWDQLEDGAKTVHEKNEENGPTLAYKVCAGIRLCGKKQTDCNGLTPRIKNGEKFISSYKDRVGYERTCLTFECTAGHAITRANPKCCHYSLGNATVAGFESQGLIAEGKKTVGNFNCVCPSGSSKVLKKAKCEIRH